MMIVENLKNIRARGTKLSYPRHALIRSRMVLTRSSGTNSYLQQRHQRSARADLEIVPGGATTRFEHRLAFLVSLVARRLFKGGVEDGVVNEHFLSSP
jgi:hypothetical protein